MTYAFGPESGTQYRLDESGLYLDGARVHVPAKALKVLRKIVEGRRKPSSNKAIAAAARAKGDPAQFARDRIKELRKCLKSKEAIVNERSFGYVLGWPITTDDFPADHVVRRPKSCRIEFGFDGLSWRSIELQGPVVTGGQIIQAAELSHPNEWILVRWIEGALVEVRRKQRLSLSDGADERFIAFKADRTYHFSLNDRDSIWGDKTIDCSVLRELASTPPADVIWIEASDGTTRRRVETQFVDLDAPGIERFFCDLRPNPKR